MNAFLATIIGTSLRKGGECLFGSPGDKGPWEVGVERVRLPQVGPEFLSPAPWPSPCQAEGLPFFSPRP